jgi:hypothetical protein
MRVDAFVVQQRLWGRKGQFWRRRRHQRVHAAGADAVEAIIPDRVTSSWPAPTRLAAD